MPVITSEVELILIECGACGTQFAMTKRYYNARCRDHRTWYCPNGCQRCYGGENDEEKLKRLLKEEKQAKEYWHGIAETERHAKNGMKGQYQKAKNELVRTKERIANGVCPCCHRQFSNLHRHMSNKHPEYSQGEIS